MCEVCGTVGLVAHELTHRDPPAERRCTHYFQISPCNFSPINFLYRYTPVALWHKSSVYLECFVTRLDVSFHFHFVLLKYAPPKLILST